MNKRLPKALREFNRICQTQKEDHANREDCRALFYEIFSRKSPYFEENTLDQLFRIQRKKQQIISEISNAIQNIDPIFDWENEGISLQVKHGGGKLSTVFRGLDIPLSKGQFLYDGIWGINYLPDESVPAILRKELMLGKAKKRILELYNQQVILYQANRKDKSFKAQNYYRKPKIHTQNVDGFHFEKVFANTIRKMASESKLKIRVESPPIHYDIEEKIDLLITIDLDTQTNSPIFLKPYAVGVQVTLQTNEYLLKKKESSRNLIQTKLEVLKLDDYRVMSFPKFPIRRIMGLWNKFECPPGGPESLLSKEEKNKLFSKMLNSVLRAKRDEGRVIGKYYFERGRI